MFCQLFRSRAFCTRNQLVGAGKVEIARSLVSDPEIILLDEPFTGIDPVTIATIQEIVRDLRDRGISILITDHQVRETLQITDRSYVIRAGQVLCHGRPDEVLAHPEARKHYFGEGMDIGQGTGDQGRGERGQEREESFSRNADGVRASDTLRAALDRVESHHRAAS